MSTKKNSFTLAEILITLGIIGIVASLTIPSLIQNYRDKETVTKLKKVYTTLSQALIQTINDNGTTVDNWNLIRGDSAEGSQNLRDIYFKKYFKIADDCQKVNQCIGSKKYLYLNGVSHIAYNGQNSYKHLVLADGTLLTFHVADIDKCSDHRYACAHIFVDTNGYFRGPNQFGKDFFVFSLLKNKVIPMGGTSPEYSANTCVKREGYGNTCALWVLTYENLDYLHCDGLSWNGKTSCK